jgi:hypothetical protein
MKTELWPMDQIIPYAKNPRKISEKAIDKVALSIKEFGWRQPIVVDQERVIIVGTVRYLAAKKLGLDQVPVHVAEGLTPAQVRAYRLMDNRSHQETSWDLELLTLEMVELKALDLDLNFHGLRAPRDRRISSECGGGRGSESSACPARQTSLSRRRFMAVRGASSAAGRRDQCGTCFPCSGRPTAAPDDD